jgi:nucleoid-associated protein YgaU
VTTPATPAEVLPASLFETPKLPGDKSTETLLSKKVESWAARRASAAATPDGPAYTVQAGDSLWKIAASQLGSGTRCDDIAKLNADVLKGKDALMPGMKLRLPPKS